MTLLLPLVRGSVQKASDVLKRWSFIAETRDRNAADDSKINPNGKIRCPRCLPMMNTCQGSPSWWSVPVKNRSQSRSLLPGGTPRKCCPALINRQLDNAPLLALAVIIKTNQTLAEELSFTFQRRKTMIERLESWRKARPPAFPADGPSLCASRPVCVVGSRGFPTGGSSVPSLPLPQILWQFGLRSLTNQSAHWLSAE